MKRVPDDSRAVRVPASRTATVSQGFSDGGMSTTEGRRRGAQRTAGSFPDLLALDPQGRTVALSDGNPRPYVSSMASRLPPPRMARVDRLSTDFPPVRRGPARSERHAPSAVFPFAYPAAGDESTVYLTLAGATIHMDEQIVVRDSVLQP